MLYRILSFAAAALLCGSVAHANVVRQSGGAVQQVVEVSDNYHRATQSNCDSGWANMPDAFVSIKIPAGSNQLLTVRFTGEASAGDQNGGADYGALRIMMGQRELLPADPTNIYFASIPGYNLPAALERSIIAVPGVHTIQVQFCVGGSIGAEMDVYDWHLTVEANPLQ